MNSMATDDEFGQLCALVAELARHTKTLALGTQGLTVHKDLNEISEAAERLREKASGG
jgi:hypothetical protein